MTTKKQQEEQLKQHLQTSKERQKIAATILLYISNLCTDFQLNPDFKFSVPAEKSLVTSLRELLSLPLVIADNTATVTLNESKSQIEDNVQPE